MPPLPRNIFNWFSYCFSLSLFYTFFCFHFTFYHYLSLSVFLPMLLITIFTQCLLWVFESPLPQLWGLMERGTTARLVFHLQITTKSSFPTIFYTLGIYTHCHTPNTHIYPLQAVILAPAPTLRPFPPIFQHCREGGPLHHSYITTYTILAPFHHLVPRY